MTRYVRVLALAWMLVLVFASVVWSQGRVETYGGHPVVADEVLVKFRSGAPAVAPLVAAHLADADVAQPVGRGTVHRFRSRTKSVATLLQDLALHPDVEYVEPNYILHATAAPNDALFGNLWGLQNNGQVIGGVVGLPGADIGAVPAWAVTTGSRANVVAVIDTGVDYTHPDLVGNVWSAPTAFSVRIAGVTVTCPAGSHGFNAITGTCNPMDDNNHGTHVAGTIGAAGNSGAGVAGVNWAASIMGLKFLDSTGSGTTSAAISAIDFAVQAKAVFATTAAANVRVLSASWGGGGFSQALLDAINRANGSGMLFVAAAGNSAANNDGGAFYPANYSAPNVIAVAATTNTDTLASFSNYGSRTVHLGAPGLTILSTIRGGQYAYYSGTSMATPHVSGAAALVLARCALDTASLKATLLNSVTAVSSLAGRTITGGRLSVNRALAACASGPVSPDFTLALSPSIGTVAIGGTTTYAVTVTASGGFTGSVGLAVSGLPAGATASFSPASVTASGSATLTVRTGTTVASGTSTVRVTGTAGSLSRTASVTLVTLVASADLTITTTASAPSVTQGSNVAFTLRVANNGPTGATGVVVTDTLPAGLSFVSVTTTQGSCTGTATVSCAVGALAKNGTATVTLVATATANGNIRNTGSVRATEPDPSTANNTSTATLTVSGSPRADLALTLTGNPSTVNVGATYRLVIGARNAGPSAAHNVTITGALPSATRLLSGTVTQGTCTATTSSLTCRAGTMASGGSMQIAIWVQAVSRATVTTRAAVSGAETDPNPGNNAVTIATTIK
jgi:uncharacterized repeat protein (TIGR01451 family)